MRSHARCFAVPQDQRKHTHRLLQGGIHPPRLDSCEQRFRVRMAAPSRPASTDFCQLVTQDSGGYGFHH